MNERHKNSRVELYLRVSQERIKYNECKRKECVK